MKKFLALVSVAFGCLASGAVAADVSQSGDDWSGPYVGVGIGYGGGSAGNSWRNDGMTDWEVDGTIKYRSLLGGGYVGIQQQFGKVVVGAEADYTWMSFDGDDSRVAGVVNGLELNGVGTARARLGWVLDRSLLYVTGGVAYGEITKFDTSLVHSETSANVTGWTAGVGAEHAFTENWIGRIAYQYIDLGSAETLLRDAVIGSYSHRANDLTAQSLQVGLSYKF